MKSPWNRKIPFAEEQTFGGCTSVGSSACRKTLGTNSAIFKKKKEIKFTYKSARIKEAQIENA